MNTIAQSFIGELSYDTISTRKMLERLNPSLYGYKPHEKSMPLGELASHIADGLGWGVITCKQTVMIMDPKTYVPFIAKSQDELLAKFDESLKASLAAIAETDDAGMMVNWSLKTPEGHVMFSGPRVQVLRSFLLNHHIHHRAQLGVYMRINNIALPSVYGPSADDNGGM